MWWNSPAFIKKNVSFLIIDQIPAFTHFFYYGKWKPKNSLWVSVPRSLSMFSQSGSICEFRWAFCSSQFLCLYLTHRLTYPTCCTHTYTQTHIHRAHYTLMHVPAITGTHKDSLPLEFQCCVSNWESSASTPHSISPFSSETSAINIFFFYHSITPNTVSFLAHFPMLWPLTFIIFEETIE